MKLKLLCGITEKEAAEGVTKKTEERRPVITSYGCAEASFRNILAFDSDPGIINRILTCGSQCLILHNNFFKRESLRSRDLLEPGQVNHE